MIAEDEGSDEEGNTEEDSNASDNVNKMCNFLKKRRILKMSKLSFQPRRYLYSIKGGADSNFN